MSQSRVIRVRDKDFRCPRVKYQQLLLNRRLRIDEPPRNETFNVAAAHIANSTRPGDLHSRVCQ